MATLVTHLAAGAAAALSVNDIAPSPSKKHFIVFVALCFVGATFADIDHLDALLGWKEHHYLGHRGMTHSLFFALALSAALAYFANKTLSERLSNLEKAWLMLCTLSHPIFDFVTTGRKDTLLFFPFYNERTTLDLSPIQAIGFQVDGLFLQMLLYEIILIWPFLALFHFMARSGTRAV